jgi:hypothetical protein
MVKIKFLTKKSSNNEIVDHSEELPTIRQAMSFWRGWFSSSEIKFGKPIVEEKEAA